jgi:hypothetical protein
MYWWLLVARKDGLHPTLKVSKPVKFFTPQCGLDPGFGPALFKMGSVVSARCCSALLGLLGSHPPGLSHSGNPLPIISVGSPTGSALADETFHATLAVREQRQVIVSALSASRLIRWGIAHISMGHSKNGLRAQTAPRKQTSVLMPRQRDSLPRI